MAIYKKSENKWRVRIWHQGQRADWIVEGDKNDALGFEAQKRLELQKKGSLPQNRAAPKFSDFCVKTYAPHAETHLKKRTWTNRQYTIATLVEFFGDLKLTEITTPIGEEYQRKRLRDKNQASTINDDVKVLRAILNYALYLGVPAVELVLKNLPVRKKKRLGYWTQDQAQMLLATLAELYPDLYWVTLFLLETGCRKGEALALEFRDVDLKHWLIRIQPNEEWQPKDGEAREIPIDPNGPLGVWLADEATSGRRFVFVSARRNEDTGLHTPFAFWPQRKFDIARLATGHRSSCKGCKATKAPAWLRPPAGLAFACAEHGMVGGPHTTRHTYATHFLASQPDLYLLGRILGHSHERVTKLYAHLLPDHLERARGAVRFAAPFGVAEMKARMRWGGLPDDGD
jgi:integrase